MNYRLPKGPGTIHGWSPKLGKPKPTRPTLLGALRQRLGFKPQEARP
jgi:hypothetical protein